MQYQDMIIERTISRLDRTERSKLHILSQTHGYKKAKVIKDIVKLHYTKLKLCF